MNSRREMNKSELSSQKGVTLVELLVAMAVTGVVLAGVVQVLVDNRMKFRLNNELAYIQENARFALDEMGRELREAGYSGCSGTAQVANVVNGTSVIGGFGLEGWDGAEVASNFPAEFQDDLWGAGSAAAPDAFMVSGGDVDNSYTTTGSPTNTNNSVRIDVTDTHPVPQGAIMVVASVDCSQISIFQNTLTNNNATASQFLSNTGNSVSPGNCSGTLLGGSGTCSSMGGLTTKNIPPGSSVYQYVSKAYYIGASSIDATIPSLYREGVSTDGSGTAVSTAEELLIGVENMQLKYGIDTDATADGVANLYVDADDVTGAGNLNWGRVTSVRIELLMRSLDGVWGEDTTFRFDGTDYTDRLLRQRISTSVQLRNLALTQ